MAFTKKQILWTDTDLSIKQKDIGVESKGIKYRKGQTLNCC